MSWLNQYYNADDLKSLSPMILAEGKTKAVVRLQRTGRKTGKPSVAYVMLQKNGRHNTSSQVALHEGPASPDTLKKLVERLQREDP